MIDHHEAREAASASLDGPLTKDMERELALHLVGCVECKTFYDSIHGVKSALSRLAAGDLPDELLQAAIHRSTTVLAGDADPGPPDDLEARHSDTGPISLPDFAAPVPVVPVEQEPLPDLSADESDPTPQEDPDESELESTRPMPAWMMEDDPSDSEPPPPPSKTVMVLGPDGSRPQSTPHEYPEAELPDLDVPERQVPAAERPPLSIGPPPLELDIPNAPMAESPHVGGGHVRMHNPDLEGEPASTEFDPPRRPREGDRLIWQPDDISEPKRRVGPAVLALVVVLLLAGVAAFALSRNSDPTKPAPTPDLPALSAVRKGVAAAFDDLESLSTNYKISRLSVYRFKQEAGRELFSFSQATETGRVAYQAPDSLREERSLQVPDSPVLKTTTVRTPEGLRVLDQKADGRTLKVDSSPPFGPPASTLIPRLGVLDQAVSSAVELFQAASDVKVVGETKIGTQRGIKVKFGVRPDEFTRADSIEMVLDHDSYMPLRITRSIARADAQVLGEPTILTASKIDEAFNGRKRLATEVVELDRVDVNGTGVLPADFTLEVPTDVTPTAVTSGFKEIGKDDTKLKAITLTPADLPAGYRTGTSIYETGKPVAWGPKNRYPGPTSTIQTLFTNGRTTIVVDQRKMAKKVPITTSPIPGTLIPLVSREVTSASGAFTYAISPEVPPHVFGYVGDIFVTVSGYAPLDDLLKIASSLTPAETPAPSTSPGASPRSSGSPAATSAPRATTKPTSTP